MKDSKRLLLAVGVLLAASLMRAPISTIGPLTRQIQASLGLSSGSAGLITTIPLILFAVIAPIAGKYLPRFHTPTVVLCCMILVFSGSIIRSWLGLAGLYGGILAIGMGVGTLNVLLPALIRENFKERIGLILGFYNSTLNLSSALSSGFSASIAAAIGSWQPAAALWGFPALIGIPIWLLINRRSSAQERSAGGQGEVSEERPKLTRQSWMIACFMGLQAMVYYCILSWLPSILATKTNDPQLPGTLLLVLQFVSLITCFIVPILTQRESLRKWISIAASSFYFIGLGLILRFSAIPVLVIGCVLAGLSSGTSYSYTLTLISMSGRTKAEITWSSGFTHMVGYGLAAIGPLLLGVVFDLTKSWTGPILILMTIAICLAFVGIQAGQKQPQADAG